MAANLERISIAPDWALGGSVNMLDELRVASELNRSRFGGILSSKRLFEMVTIEPARALGVDSKLGSLVVGKRADVVVLHGYPSQPYEALINAKPASIELVIVDGRVLYGDAPLKAAGPASPGCEDISICNASKFLCVAEPSTANKLNQTFSDITAAVTSGLASYDTMVAAMGIPPFSPLAPLLKCP